MGLGFKGQRDLKVALVILYLVCYISTETNGLGLGGGGGPDLSNFHLPSCCFNVPTLTPQETLNSPDLSVSIREIVDHQENNIQDDQLPLSAILLPKNTTAGEDERLNETSRPSPKNEMFRLVVKLKKTQGNEANGTSNSTRINGNSDDGTNSETPKEKRTIINLDLEDEYSPTQNKSDFENNGINTSSINQPTLTPELDLPNDWMEKLRFALYQSMTPSLGLKKGQGKGKSPETKLWKSLQDVQLDLMEMDHDLDQEAKGTESSLTLPSTVSGVFVNTKDGLHIRASPIPNRNHIQPGLNEECHCHLIQHGDMLLALWTVHQVIDNLGQNSLEYLVYPVPHNVPTPPIFEPFLPDKFLRPSPIDPNHLISSRSVTSNHPHQDFPHQLQTETQELIHKHFQDPIHQQAPFPSFLGLSPIHGNRRIVSEGQGQNPSYKNHVLGMYRQVLAAHLGLHSNPHSLGGQTPFPISHSFPGILLPGTGGIPFLGVPIDLPPQGHHHKRHSQSPQPPFHFLEDPNGLDHPKSIQDIITGEVPQGIPNGPPYPFPETEEIIPYFPTQGHSYEIRPHQPGPETIINDGYDNFIYKDTERQPAGPHGPDFSRPGTLNLESEYYPSGIPNREEDSNRRYSENHIPCKQLQYEKLLQYHDHSSNKLTSASTGIGIGRSASSRANKNPNPSENSYILDF